MKHGPGRPGPLLRAAAAALSRILDPTVFLSFDRSGFRRHAINFDPADLDVDLTGRTCLVTGANSGIGLATDGDSDRIGVLDENGTFITQLQVFALLDLYLLEVRGERGAIVKSVTTTDMAYRLGELFSVPVHETAVGFKYLGPKMMAENALIGGEESSGFGFRGHIPERDGILAGLYPLLVLLRLLAAALYGAFRGLG